MAFIIGKDSGKDKTICGVFLERVAASANRVGFQFKDNSGWSSLTFREFYDEARTLSYGLIALGAGFGDRVAVISRNRVEWPLVDMAILGTRSLTVPIDPTLVGSELARLIKHSGSKIALVENATQLEKILVVREKDPDAFTALEKIIVFEPEAMKFAVNPQRNEKSVLTLQALRELGKREESRAPTRFDDQLRAARPQDPFTICYTTGTTGDPKGVVLTHANLMSVIDDCLLRMSRRVRSERETLLASMPISHILGRVGVMIFYAMGGKLVFGATPEEASPTLLFAVPQVFEKAYAAIQSLLETDGARARKWTSWAWGAGRAYHEAFWGGKNPSLKSALEYSLAKRLVFKRVSEKFGGKLRYAICGGAPLRRELGEFFEIAGIRILEGYGLTETCAPVTLNDPDHPRFGTVGKPLQEVSIKIAEDGEILIQSGKVFHHYYQNDAESERVKSGGWFHTGDMGFLDAEGFLHVTDRKKDILVLSTGKKVAPQKVEQLARAHPLIREVVAFGDSRPFVVALITLEADVVIAQATEQAILFSEYEGLVKNPRVVSWIEKWLEEVNPQLAPHEQIRKFMILPQDFSAKDGELASSFKVRRKAVYQRYQVQIESLYS